MTDIMDRLAAVAETGCPPELIDDVMAEITRLRSDLNASLADAINAYDKLNGLHVSARAHRDRVRELEAECAGLRAELAAAQRDIETGYAETHRLTVEADRLRKDAERWRYVFQRNAFVSVDLSDRLGVCGKVATLVSDIDAAITKGA